MRPPPPSRWSRLPPQLRRLIIACMALFVIWVFFIQAVPRALQPTTRSPPPQPAAEYSVPPPPPTEPPAAIPETQAPIETAPAETAEAAPPPADPAPVPPAQEASAALPPPAAEVEQLKTVEEKLDHLTELAQRRSQHENEAVHLLEEQLHAQGQAIEALKEQQRQALHMIELMDAYDRLRERVLSGTPYAAELARIQELATGHAGVQAALTPLAEYAALGIPTSHLVYAGFSLAARRALLPHPGQGAGFMEQVRANLSQLMTIRRVGYREGTAPDAVIARAEAALERQDIDGAIREIAVLQGTAAEAMRAWLAHAQAHAARDAWLADLRTAILSVRAQAPNG